MKLTSVCMWFFKYQSSKEIFLTDAWLPGKTNPQVFILCKVPGSCSFLIFYTLARFGFGYCLRYWYLTRFFWVSVFVWLPFLKSWINLTMIYGNLLKHRMFCSSMNYFFPLSGTLLENTWEYSAPFLVLLNVPYNDSEWVCYRPFSCCIPHFFCKHSKSLIWC